MRIESAKINAGAVHEEVRSSVKKESLEFWVGERRPGGQRPAEAPAGGDRLSLTPKAQAGQPVSKTLRVDDEMEQLSPRDRLIADILRRMMKALTGQDLKLFSPSELAQKVADAQQSTAETGAQLQQAQQSQAAAQQPQSAGFGLIYDHYESHYEYEAVSYSAQGVVKTADGKEIQFSVQLNMSREFYSENKETLRLGDAAKKIDPLVVNFDGNAADLGDTKFQFDLDSDGREEQLSVLNPGSGFLALDKNSDGAINNGSELFGASSGDGFAELAAYDEDKNGFIDEGDSVYNKLRIWLQDGQGNGQLLALGEKNIGAIYLGHVSTPFTYKDGANNTQGDVASTGLFLREDGSAGTVQQIDYSV